jgi:hypothetical protein
VLQAVGPLRLHRMHKSAPPSTKIRGPDENLAPRLYSRTHARTRKQIDEHQQIETQISYNTAVIGPMAKAYADGDNLST